MFSFHGGTPLPTPLFFLSSCKGDFFGNVFVSVWWWAAQAPESGLAINSVCAGKASTSHEGHFLSTAEDANNRKNKPVSHSVPNQTTHMPNIQRRGGKGLNKKAPKEAT